MIKQIFSELKVWISAFSLSPDVISRATVCPPRELYVLFVKYYLMTLVIYEE